MLTESNQPVPLVRQAPQALCGWYDIMETVYENEVVRYDDIDIWVFIAVLTPTFVMKPTTNSLDDEVANETNEISNFHSNCHRFAYKPARYASISRWYLTLSAAALVSQFSRSSGLSALYWAEMIRAMSPKAASGFSVFTVGRIKTENKK